MDKDVEFATPEERGDFLEKQSAEPEAKDEPTDEEVATATGKDTATDDEAPDNSGDTDGVNAAEPDTAVDASGEDDEGVEELRKGIRVPKFRLDAALARAREAELKLEEMLKKAPAESKEKEEATPEQTATEIRDEAQAEIDEKIAGAMADGDTKLVSSLMAESRKIERDFINATLNSTVDSAKNATTEQVREEAKLSNVLDELEGAFPIFDAASDQFDADANTYVLRLQRAFIAEGMTKADALVEAANYAIPALGLVDNAKAEGDTVEDAKKAVPPKPANRAKENIDAASRQPPDTSEMGDDSDSEGIKDMPNALELTEKEFDALPEDTKRRMRGDFA